MAFSFKKTIDKLFYWGILLKAFFGFFEILGGVLFTFSKKIITDNFLIRMAQEEIADDPNDIIANYIVKSAQNISQDSRVFAVAYLFFHGAVNIFLAISLAKGKARNYPAIMGLLLLFIFYQTYKFATGKSWSVLFLTLFDIAFVLIILLEYKKYGKTAKR